MEDEFTSIVSEDGSVKQARSEEAHGSTERVRTKGAPRKRTAPISVADIRSIMMSMLDVSSFEGSLDEAARLAEDAGMLYLTDAPSGELRGVLLSTKAYGQLQSGK